MKAEKLKEESAVEVAAYMQKLGQQAREASRVLARATTNNKNAALLAIATAIRSQADGLKTANKQDLQAGKAKGLDAAMLDRLTLTDDRIESMAQGLEQIAALPDPIGEISDMRYRPSGIQLGQMRVPLGVIGIIYESRPNVTADAAGLCLKSGNATILRGGSEAIHSNQAIADCIHQGLQQAGLPITAVQVVEITDREVVGQLITMPEYVDVIVPRGGKRCWYMLILPASFCLLWPSVLSMKALNYEAAMKPYIFCRISPWQRTPIGILNILPPFCR